MQSSIACLLGAGFSYVAGVPLARDLLKPNWLITMSERSRRRFFTVREHYENWQREHAAEYPEQYMGLVYTQSAGPDAPQWDWVVEYVCAAIASAGTPPASLNRNPRYSSRVNRPFYCTAHQQFWNALFSITRDVSVITTNYDILVERVLRHRPMRRPWSRGCFYGGLARPQILRGAAQPFSRWAPERIIEMTGTIPVFKLHGSLNWTLNGQSIVTFQDMRPAFRHGGTAAIMPPVPEKLVPPWLHEIWREAELSLRRSDVWVICGYSLPAYDTEVLRLLKKAGIGRPLSIFLLSPEADVLQKRWTGLLPEASIMCLPGLPEGIEPLAHRLPSLPQ
jgi:SIR2-like domain